MGTLSLCTFTMGPDTFALEADRVQEVLRTPILTPVPLAPRQVAGLINLRGHVVLTYDLRERLGLPQVPVESIPYCLVLRREGVGSGVGLLVDGIGSVPEASLDDLGPPPGTLQGEARKLIRATLKSPDVLLLILDVEQTLLLDFEEKVTP